MIRGFKHRGLQRFYNKDDHRRLPAESIEKVRDILAALDAASVPEDMNRPSFRLHPLRGKLKGLWAVTVSANWRIVFRLADGEAWDVDFIDYH